MGLERIQQCEERFGELRRTSTSLDELQRVSVSFDESR